MPSWSVPEDKTLEQCGVFGGECLIYYVVALEAGLMRHKLMYDDVCTDVHIELQ